MSANRKRTRARVGRTPSRPLSRLPLAQVGWEGDTLSMARLAQLPEAELPEYSLAMWVEADTATVMAARFFEPAELPEAAAELLLEAMRRPGWGRPRRPVSVFVRDPGLARAVQSRVATLEIDVVLRQRLSAWDELAAEMAAYLAAHRPERSYLAGAGVTPDTMARFFAAAAAYYRAKPWALLDDDVPLELRFAGEDPIYAVVLGGAGAVYGLSIFFSAQELASLIEQELPLPLPARDTLVVTYEREEIVPPRMRAERRSHRWPLAGPAAIPLTYRQMPDGTVREPDAREIERMAQVLLGLAAFVGRSSSEIAARWAVSDAITIEDFTGAPLAVDIVAPAPLSGAAPQLVGRLARRTRPEAAAPPPGRSPLLEEIRERIMELPHGRATVRRLAWSFFREGTPEYVEDDDEVGHWLALSRFLDWAHFFVRLPGGATLAEQALDMLAPTLPPDELERRRRFTHPRYSVYEVRKVDPGEGLVVRDIVQPETLRVRERRASYQVRKGWTLIGPLFPVGDDEYVLDSAITPFDRPPPRRLKEMPAGGGEEFAPALEAVFYGANAEWIEELESRAEVKQAYQEFREALAGAGQQLPGYAQLERRIRATDRPAELLAQAMGPAGWWTEIEPTLFLALLTRAWNLTPRRELGGRSPLEVHSEAGDSA